MSEYHKPTFTFPDDAYHATQVRLYGIPATGRVELPSRSIAFTIGKTEVGISSSDRHEIDPDRAEKAEAILRKLDFSRLDTWPLLQSVDVPTQVAYHIPFKTNRLGTVFIVASFDFDDALRDQAMSPGIIYGYAYEGHCYDLPKPKVMIIPDLPRGIPDDDCGYKEKESEGYRLWIVDKLDQCVEIEVNQGFVEQLVLEANLPGRRSPSTYRATMALSHRSGRLTD